jgi:hypothetical protein
MSASGTSGGPRQGQPQLVDRITVAPLRPAVKPPRRRTAKSRQVGRPDSRDRLLSAILDLLLVAIEQHYSPRRTRP